MQRKAYIQYLLESSIIGPKKSQLRQLMTAIIEHCFSFEYNIS